MGRRELGDVQVRDKHVDIYEGSDLQWSKQHAELQVAKNQIHNGSRELGVR